MHPRLIFARQHYALPHCWMLQKSRLNFTQFNTEAAKFNLEIQAAQVFDIAIRKEARQVAGFIKPRARVLREWIGNELFFRQFRPLQIAARQAHTANMQFARNADRHRAQIAVQNINLRVPDWLANGDNGAAALRSAVVIGNVYRSLRGPIEVMQLSRQAFEKALLQIEGQRLTAANHPPHTSTAAHALGFDKNPQHGRHKVHGGDALRNH